MMSLALALFITTATAGFDVDDVGLSALERSAIVERARAELGDATKGVEIVDAPGLASCTEGSTDATAASPSTDPIVCAREALASAGAVAGAAIRVVKVLQVVRVDLVVLDREGLAVLTSTRTLDVEGAAKGPLFDEAARAALVKLAPRSPAQRTEANASTSSSSSSSSPSLSSSSSSSSTPTASGTMTFAALGAGAAGVVIALVGSGFATNEALLANSPSSSGDEKERARIFGPLATATAVVGVGIAVAAPVILLSLE